MSTHTIDPGQHAVSDRTVLARKRGLSGGNPSRPVARNIHHVPLGELPADVEVPEDLQPRFWFDAERKRLCFDGFMCKYTFDRLERLSSDRQYLCALDELFRIAVPEEQGRGWKRALTVIGALVGLLVLSGITAWLVLMR